MRSIRDANKVKKVVDKQSDMRYNEKARQERMPEGHKHK